MPASGGRPPHETGKKNRRALKSNREAVSLLKGGPIHVKRKEKEINGQKRGRLTTIFMEGRETFLIVYVGGEFPATEGEGEGKEKREGPESGEMRGTLLG